MEALAKKCKLKCPVCQREADRIVVRDAADDERVPALRRCKSAETVREELEDEILGMRRAVVPVQREPPNQTVAEGARNAQKGLARDRYFEALRAIRKLLTETPAVQRAKVPGQQESSSQMVSERRQVTQRSLTLRIYMEALSALKQMFDTIWDCCGAEVQLQQESSSQTVAEGSQNMQTYSVMKLYDELMSVLEETMVKLLSTYDAETQGHLKATSETVAEDKHNAPILKLMSIYIYSEATSVLGKLSRITSHCDAVGTPIQQVPSDQTVIEDTWTLRHVPPLHRSESATFSWDNQCPFSQTTQDSDHKIKCVFIRLMNCRTPTLLQQASVLLH